MNKPIFLTEFAKNTETANLFLQLRNNIIMKNTFLAGFILFSAIAKAQPVVLTEVVTGKSNTNEQRTYSPPAGPATYSLFGENIPLHIPDVKERLERELLVNTYMHASNLYILQLSTRWLPMIEAKLKACLLYTSPSPRD